MRSAIFKTIVIVVVTLALSCALVSPQEDALRQMWVWFLWAMAGASIYEFWNTK